MTTKTILAILVLAAAITIIAAAPKPVLADHLCQFPNGTIVSCPAVNATAINHGGGCSGDCTPPTLGVDARGFRIVEDGFLCKQGTTRYQANAERYHTETPLLIFEVGKLVHCEAKVYENSGNFPGATAKVGWGLGVPQDKWYGNAAVQVEYNVAWDGATHYTETDTQDLIDLEYVGEDRQACRSASEDICLVSVIEFIPKQKLTDTAMVIDTMDQRRNAWQHRFNDGVQFVGQSLNPDRTFDVMDGRKLTQITTKADDTKNGVDASGSKWSFNTSWQKEHIPIDNSCKKTKHGFDRNCPEFTALKQSEALRASASYHS